MTNTPETQNPEPHHEPLRRPAGTPGLKPPPLPKRFIYLLLDPDKWAQAAMYPASVTFWPLLLALVIAAICMGYSMSANSIGPLNQFAATYDRHYLPMLLNKGELSIIKPVVKTKLVPLNLRTPFERIIADPSLSGTSTLTTHPFIALFNRNSVVLTGSELGGTIVLLQMSQVQRELLAFNQVLTPALSKSTPTNKLPSIRVDSHTLLALMPMIALLLGPAMALASFLKFSIWTLLMIVLTGFLIMMINRNLGMPLKAAWRISMAVMIPLLILRGILAVSNLVPAINPSPIIDEFIFMAPIGLSLWAGVLANRMFSQPRGGPPRKP